MKFSLSNSVLTSALFLTALAPSVAMAQVTIDSEPRGVPFTLEGLNHTHYRDGVTPVSFDDLPNVQLIVHYGDTEGCVTPKPQTRFNTQLLPIHFFGRYDCDPKEPTPAPTPVVPVDEFYGKAAIKLTPHQMEVVPGGSIRYSLSVHNLSKTTQQDLTVSVQFDPSQMNIKDNLPYGGKIDGNGLVVWDVPVLFAGQTWQVSFPVEVLSSVADGQRLYVSSRVSSPDLIADSSDSLSTKVMVGTPIMPPTGMRFDVLFALMVMLLATCMTALHRKVVFSRV